MRRVALAPVLLAVCIVHAAGSQNTERPEDWPEGSAMRTGLLARQALDKLDRTIAARHAELANAVAAAGADSRLQAALKKQQAAWKKYVPEECELVGAATGAGGAWPSTYAVQCEVGLADQRAKRLQEALACVKKNADAQDGIGDCLSAVAPLAGKS